MSCLVCKGRVDYVKFVKVKIPTDKGGFAVVYTPVCEACSCSIEAAGRSLIEFD